MLIGTTTDKGLKRRLAALQHGNPELLTITHLFDGDERLERSLHVRFSDYHLRGDWYRHEILDNLPDDLPRVPFDPDAERRRLAAEELRDLGRGRA